MKRMKKIAGLLLAVIMMLAMTVAASAEEFTITGPNNNHTYEVYQIFTGDLDGEVLSNVKWGKNGNRTVGEAVDPEILAALEGVAASTDVEKLAVIKKYANLTATNKFGTVKKDQALSAPAGYYLIKDVDGALEGTDDSYTLYIVQVLGNLTITPKGNKPSSEKKVIDKNDSDNTTTGWQDSADYDIGDEISYQLKATLPDNVSDYTTYSLSFVDTMSKGLTYKAGSAVVKVNGNQVGTLEPTSATYAGTESESAYTGGTVLTWSIADVKATPYSAGNNAVITIEYTATLNENAVIGSAGNPNMMHIEYSNNPNGSGTGKTPDDTNIVFTYKTVVNKVQENPEFDKDQPEGEENQKYIPLEGAGFTLYKKNSTGTYDKVGDEQTGVTTFTFSGLDDGDYKLEETTTPAGYNTIAPIEFTITAEHDVVSDNPALTSLSVAVTSGTATFTSATSDGSLTTDVVNQKGATLPETGGIGTTIFYVLGTILVLGAGILLITKKRMGADK